MNIRSLDLTRPLLTEVAVVLDRQLDDIEAASRLCSDPDSMGYIDRAEWAAGMGHWPARQEERLMTSGWCVRATCGG